MRTRLQTGWARAEAEVAAVARQWRPSWTPAVLGVLAAVWTWPALATSDLLGRRADALGTAWLVSAAPRLWADRHDALTAWPAGADYTRPDSWVLLAVAAAGDALAPARLIGLFVWVGVLVSAWAAEALARELGARAPWSLVAGIGYAFSGLGATALVEGYPYHVVDPWLPLGLLAGLRAVDHGGRPLHGVAAAAAFGMALATSAWHGVVAAFLAAGLLLGGRLAGRCRLGPVAAGAGGVVLVAAAYLLLDAGAAPAALAPTGAGGHTSLAARLWLHTAPPPSVDIDGRGQTAWSSSVMLAGALAAPLCFRHDWRVRTLLGTGLVGLALAVLPVPWAWMVAQAPDSGLASLYGALARFPERLGWTWLAAAAPLAARTVTELVDRHGLPAAGLLIAAVLECVVAPGMPARLATVPAQVPSVYHQGSGPVLDLWPETLGPDPAWDLRVTNTGCFYQSGHHRPIADLCLLAPGVVSPRVELGGWLTDTLFRGGVEAARARLDASGFTTVTWHPDLFRPADRAVLAAALERLDPYPEASTDGGDHVIAYSVHPPELR